MLIMLLVLPKAVQVKKWKIMLTKIVSEFNEIAVNYFILCKVLMKTDSVTFLNKNIELL